MSHHQMMRHNFIFSLNNSLGGLRSDFPWRAFDLSLAGFCPAGFCPDLVQSKSPKLTQSAAAVHETE